MQQDPKEQAPDVSKKTFCGGLLEDIRIGDPTEESTANQGEDQPAMCMITEKELGDHLAILGKKYFDLVWYSRSDPDHPGLSEAHRARIISAQNRIEATYPKEIDALCSETDNWECGFNNGMMAGVRFVLTAMDYGLELAEDEFPFLDT